MARPQKRTKLLHFRVSPTQKTHLEDQAKRVNRSLSDYLRDALILAQRINHTPRDWNIAVAHALLPNPPLD